MIRSINWTHVDFPFTVEMWSKDHPPDSQKVNFKAHTSKWRAFARKITNTSRDGETFCLEEATRSISQMWICRDKIDWQVNTGTEAMCRRDRAFFLCLSRIKDVPECQRSSPAISLFRRYTPWPIHLGSPRNNECNIALKSEPRNI